MPNYNRVDEDLDEYEENGEDEYEEAEEQEEEEDPAKQEEISEYLELRQKLKEKIRRKLERESGVALSNSQDKKKKAPLQSFGSFFGPSQPVIADRVLQESKSLLETQHLALQQSSSQNDKKKNIMVGTSRPKNGVTKDKQLQNPLKTKVQKLKDARDYSFLLCNDAEVPGQVKDSSQRNNSDARSAQGPGLSMRLGKASLNGHRESNFSGRRDARSEQSMASSMRLGKVSLSRHEERKPTNSHFQRTDALPVKKVSSGSRPDQMTVDSKRELNSKRLLEHKKPLVSSNGSGPGRPVVAKDLSSKKPVSYMDKKLPVGTDRKAVASMVKKAPVASAEKKASAVTVKHSTSNVQRATLTKSQTPGIRSGMEQRRETLDSSKQRHLSSEPVSSSKLQPISKAKEVSSRASLVEDQLKKRPKPVRQSFDDEDDEYNPMAISSMIRKMFRYDPRKHADIDDDLSDMEADFRTIEREEKRSARIAREEDEREARLLEEEERRARMRKEAKKRKMSQC
ncbi:hypothetical protein Ancab_011895 [Ancistrocladus abbreviatus]